MSESEYKYWVLADYDEKLLLQLLPSELLLPSPANIKAEILRCCERDLSAADEKILRSFVGEKEDVAAYRKAFSTGRADPFRPLVNLLGDRSINPNIRSVDLLALLIGFNPRPYHPGLKIASIPKDIQTVDPVPTPVDPVPEPLNPAPILVDPAPQPVDFPISVPKPANKPLNKKAIAFTSMILLAIAIFTIWKIRSTRYNGKEGCMIWNQDRYEPFDCNKKSTVMQIHPVNWHWVENFRQIDKPDTLSPYCIGKVWYTNYKGRTDIFTDSATYPLDTNRRLFKMTDHAYKKYVLHLIN